MRLRFRPAAGALALLLSMPATGAQAQGMGMGPPQEAFSACAGQARGTSCAFRTPRGSLSGTCASPPGGDALVCMPANAPRGGPPPSGQRPGGGLRVDSFSGLPGGLRGMQSGPPSRGYTPAAPYAAAAPLDNRLTDTGQVTCFSDQGKIDCATAAESGFPGQDAHFASRAQSFQVRGDGTVFDPATGLIWQQGHNSDRLPHASAARYCAGLTLGGRDDWRLPTIKELFTITHWQGATGSRFFVAPAFDLKPPASLEANDRYASTHHVDMMGQTWSSTVYAGDHFDRPGMKGVFFFNFLDGRIKQGPYGDRGMGLFYRCVAGTPWGNNAFTDNGDGTVSDGLSGLTWQQADDGQPRDWGAALRYCDGLTLAGHDDWRLPNVKELQTIVDYSRRQPAIDPIFTIKDPKAWFWSSTTMGEDIRDALYVCFGKCTSYQGVDVHGAGAQRSDPKSGTPRASDHRGGQEDEIRINNHARCVRG